MKKSTFLVSAAILAGLVMALPFGNTARAWEPEGTVEFIVPAGPGGSYDRAARALQKIIEQYGLLKVPMNVINRPGGGGNIGLNYLLGRPADGRSLFIASTAILANHIVGRSDKTYSDLTVLANLYEEYIATTVNANSTLADPDVFMAKLKNDPSSVSVGFCCTRGGGNHLAAALLVREAGGQAKDLTAVVFKSSGEMIPAVLGNHIDVASSPASNVLGQVEDGQMKFLAIAAPKHLSGRLKGVPIWRDYGLDVVISLTRVMYSQPGLDAEKRVFWENLFEKVSDTPEWQELAGRNLWQINFMRGKETEVELKKNYALMKSLLNDVGMLPK